MQTTADQFTCDFGALNKVYKDIYWGQILSWHTSFAVKKIAIKSLWIMRKGRLGK